MRFMGQTLAAGALLAFGLSGCDDAARKPAQAKVPALQPASPSSQTARNQIDQSTVGPLPLWNPAAKRPTALFPKVPDGKSG